MPKTWLDAPAAYRYPVTRLFSYASSFGWIGNKLDVTGLAMQKHAVPFFDFLS
jgi:hypothetical protein